MNTLFVLFCLATLAFANASTDDCESNCPAWGWNNIRCSKNENCFEATVVYDFSENDSLSGLMLDLHNNFRNKVAGGDLTGFSKATNMATMSWSEELAKNAYHNVKDCLYETNPCHNMEKGKKYGQNSVHLDFNKAEGVSDVIKKAFKYWEDTCTDIKNPNEIINSYSEPESSSDIRRNSCLRMAIENNNKIGCSCGMASETIGEGQTWWVLCNYEEENKVGQKTYNVGPEAASGCGSVNSDYTNLCSLD